MSYQLQVDENTVSVGEGRGFGFKPMSYQLQVDERPASPNDREPEARFTSPVNHDGMVGIGHRGFLLSPALFPPAVNRDWLGLLGLSQQPTNLHLEANQADVEYPNEPASLIERSAWG
ncbi:MAG: hypothetical protein RMJ56_06835 [Gemmataceae bacterium]|nr:hypothetical protein [Gemmata sp.]MDW8197304.1 hypothetical protein [Gemmataceae bacterium]